MKKNTGIIAIAAVIAISFVALASCNDGSTTVAVTGVSLNKSSLSLAVGGTETLTATVAPDNATNKTVTWKTSDATKATVADGVVTAIAAGSATITVTTADGNKTATCAVTVIGGGGSGGEVTSPTGIVMVSILAGTFTMGSPTSDPDRDSGETQHSVTLSAFSMSKYLVTQEQYQAVMAINPSFFTYSPQAGENKVKRPVETVTWYDAVEFCNKLSEQENLQSVYTISGRNPSSGYPITSATVTADFTKNGYRLPTEAQWEYACRAGTTTAYNTGAAISNDTGWYSSNSEKETHEVGKKPANAWGLYDMHGNVMEWCWDWYGSYSSGAQIDPLGASSGTGRMVRGGGWSSPAESLRSAARISYNPRTEAYYIGFRLARPNQ